ncbi:MAG: FHA domain-containing protein [Verrucomicrobiota bacterium]
MNAAQSLSLIFQSGADKGREVTLADGEELILGRGKGTDIVIDDTKASRRHARFHCVGGELFVEDLGSVNGTFVNGAKVQKALLFAGDAVEVANVRIKVQLQKEPRAGDRKESAKPAKSLSASDATMGNILSDTLDPDKLRELMRFLSARKRTGTLIVHTAWGTGRVCFREGQVYFASIDGSPAVHPLKAIHRLLRAKEGSIEFSVEPPVSTEQEINIAIDTLIQGDPDFSDAQARLERLLPATYKRLMVNIKPDDTFGAKEREILHLLGTHVSLPSVFDHFSGTDTEAARILASLAERKCLGFVK